MGKRVDAVVLYKHIVFLLEFKCGDTEYRQSTYDQVYDYAIDLRNFQKESHNKLLVPIMVSTRAKAVKNEMCERDRVIEPLRCNAGNIADMIDTVVVRYNEPAFDYVLWENSEYLPTPTIVEAAQALYRGHNVHDITRSDAGAENLTVTTDEINRIIEHSKANGRKSICFVTGVPGAGKTLVGLNIAIQRSDAQQGEHAVFLSGNFPLVTVLQEALARDKVEQEKQRGNRVSKTDALRSTSAFIQIIHKYRDSFVGNNNIPPERVAIFDEAQRAWTQDMIEKFMATKKGVSPFPYSEPEFLISTMDRHQDWAVVICLVGGGQEINTGEAGLPEWFDSLRRAFPNWDVYITPQLNDNEYRRDRSWHSMLEGLHTYEREELHLATSVRSFRTPDLAAFVKAVLDADTDRAKELYQRIKDKYPIVITRDLHRAKAWVKDYVKEFEKDYGLEQDGILSPEDQMVLFAQSGPTPKPTTSPKPTATPSIADSEAWKNWVNSQFSPWDGAHRELEKLIVKNLNDEKSYDHIKTTYIEICDEGRMDIINKALKDDGYSRRVKIGDLFITTEFSAKNRFNATVKNTAYGIASYEDNTIILVDIVY